MLESDTWIAERPGDGRALGFCGIGPDGPLLGIRRSGDWTDTIHLGGFSRDCYAVRERSTSLVVPGDVLVERRVTGDALNVLNMVLTWDRT